MAGEIAHQQSPHLCEAAEPQKKPDGEPKKKSESSQIYAEFLTSSEFHNPSRDSRKLFILALLVDEKLFIVN